MKKIIITILTLALIITAFASCVKTETETTTYEPVIEFPTEEITSEEVTTETPTTMQEETTTEVPSTEEVTTEAPTTEVPTTKVPETTIKTEEKTTEKKGKKPVENTTKTDLSIMAPDDVRSPERAGLIYDDCGRLTTYDDLYEGAHYCEYDENGNAIIKQKPYSPNNKPEYDIHTCEYCGRHRQPFDGQHYGSYYGYCCRYWIDTDCPECGEFIPNNTCHVCK